MEFIFCHAERFKVIKQDPMSSYGRADGRAEVIQRINMYDTAHYRGYKEQKTTYLPVWEVQF